MSAPPRLTCIYLLTILSSTLSSPLTKNVLPWITSTSYARFTYLCIFLATRRSLHLVISLFVCPPPLSDSHPSLALSLSPGSYSPPAAACFSQHQNTYGNGNESFLQGLRTSSFSSHTALGRSRQVWARLQPLWEVVRDGSRLLQQ